MSGARGERLRAFKKRSQYSLPYCDPRSEWTRILLRGRRRQTARDTEPLEDFSDGITAFGDLPDGFIFAFCGVSWTVHGNFSWLKSFAGGVYFSRSSPLTLAAISMDHNPMSARDSLGQYMRSIGMKSPSGAGSRLASLSSPGDSCWK